jgi:transposase
LRNSFRPTQEIRTMRTYWRQRNDLVQAAARHIQRMQKVLTQMNVQLANVLSDISGVTGQAIIKAILAGEHDPHKLAAFRDVRVKASEEQIAQYLQGHWQEDLLFVLQQEKEGFDFCQKQMAACDEQLKQYLQQQEDGFDRFIVVVECEEPGLGKCFRHQNRGSAFPAGHVRYQRSLTTTRA